MVRDCYRDLDSSSGIFGVANDGWSWASGGWELSDLPPFQCCSAPVGRFGVLFRVWWLLRRRVKARRHFKLCSSDLEVIGDGYFVRGSSPFFSSFFFYTACEPLFFFFCFLCTTSPSPHCQGYTKGRGFLFFPLGFHDLGLDLLTCPFYPHLFLLTVLMMSF